MKQVMAIIIMISFVFVGFVPSVIAEIDNKVIDRVVESVMFVRGPSGSGSGVVVNVTNAKTNNYMLTAYHVVENKSGITEMTLVWVIDMYGNEYKAEVYMTDKANDLALLRLINGEFPVTPVKVAKISQYEKGDEIFSVGYNLQGFEEGSNSGINPKENITSFPVPRVGFGHINDIRPKLVYLDIGCYSWGASGGGTFTKKGKLIGINSLILSDGAGKIGIIRPIAELNFGMEIPEEGKKKITDITTFEKKNALISAIKGDVKRPTYYYRRSPVYVKFLRLVDHYILDENEVSAEVYELWKNAGRPDKLIISYHVGAAGFYIQQECYWIQEGHGYEVKRTIISIGVEWNWIIDDEETRKGHVEYGDLVLYRNPIEIYLVCTPDNVILNMHTKWNTVIPEEKALDIANTWFDYLWNKRCVPHFKGVE